MSSRALESATHVVFVYKLTQAIGGGGGDGDLWSVAERAARLRDVCLKGVKMRCAHKAMSTRIKQTC